MADFASLTVQLELQQAAFAKGMADAAKRLDQVGKSAKKTQDDLSGLAQGFQRAASAAKAITAAYATMKSGAAIIRAADDIKSLEASFKALTGDAARGADMLQRVVDVADRTGAPLKDTGAAMQSLTIAMKNLGASNVQVADLTETFLKLGRVGGTSAESAANALRQLGQGLASGALSGDELKSIRENMPLVADAIAKAFGVTSGELKKMGADGVLTAEKVGNALLAMTKQVDADFAGMPVTLEQSINRLETRWTLFLAEFEKATQLGDRIGTVIEYIAGIFSRWTTELQNSDKQFSAVKLVADAIRITVETIAVLFANLVFIAEALTRSLAAAAAEAYAIVTLDWSKVGQAWAASEEQSAAARKQLDAFEKKILGIGEAAKVAAREQSKLLTGGGGKTGGGGADKAAKEAEAFQKRADAIAASVNPLFAYNQALAEYTELVNKGFLSDVNFALAKEKAIATLNAAGDAIRAATDPLFVYNQELEKLQMLLSANQISLETYAKAVEQAKEKMDESTGKKKEKTFMEQMEDLAATGAQALGDFFGDLISGSATAEEAFAKMAKTILSKIAEMVAAAAAAYIVKTLFSGLGGGPTGGVTGGAAPAAAMTAATSALMSGAAATEAAVSTFARGPTSPTLSASDATMAATAGNVNARPELNVVVNNNAGAEVSSRMNESGDLEITIDRVRRALARDMSRGGNVFSDTMERSFALNRTGA